MVGLLLPLGPSAAAQEGPLVAEPGLALVRQSSEVGPDGVFELVVRDEGVSDLTRAEVAVTVHSAVTSRSSFTLTVEGRLLGEVLDFLPPTPLADLPGVDGGRLLRLPLASLRLPRAPSGVYPVRVQLRDGDSRAVVDAFTTHLVVTPGPGSGLYPLAVAWAQPVHAPPALRPDGTRVLGPSLPDLAAVAGPVADHPDVPLTLAPTPETVGALARAGSQDRAAAAVLDDLRAAQDGRQVVGGPYVPVDVAQLDAAGLGGALDEQLAEGEAVLEAVLGAQPDTGTWLADGTLDGAALDRLRRLGVRQLVVPEEALAPLDRRLTLARPFLLGDRGASSVRAAVADAGLAAHLQPRRPGDEVLRAHHLLADLAVLFYDSPGRERGVVVRPPERWDPEPELLATVLAGLQRSTILQPVTVDQLLRSVPPDADGDERLVRRLAPEDPPLLGITAAEVAAARSHLAGFASMVVGQPEAVADLRHRLLVAEGAGLTVGQRRAYLQGVPTAVHAELAKIEAPDGQRITLTARRGTIPLAIRSETGYPVQVLVRVASDKLEFPEGDSRLVRLEGPNTKLEVPVRARTSGAFRLAVSLASPDGRLGVRDARLTVRSTAASWVGVALTVGAGLFLAVWWARNWHTARRDPHLVGG